MKNENAIVNVTGEVIRTSKNLRGMRDYARISPVIKISMRKDKENAVRGILRVEYENGATSCAAFASHSIMIDFVRGRRTWRGATIEHCDGATGYLTKPGIPSIVN